MTDLHGNRQYMDMDVFLYWGTRLLAAILILSVVGFGTYYYFDRRGLSGLSMVDQTMQDLETAVRSSPNNAVLRIQVGQAYFERQHYDEAITQFKAALELEKNNQQALIGLGNALMAKKDYDAASAAFKQVIDLNKNNPYRKTLHQLEAVYYELAVIQVDKGQLDDAEAGLKEALDIVPTDADAWYLLGEVKRKQQKGHESLDYYHKAVSLDPQFVEAFEAMAAVFTDMKQPEMADYANGMIALAKNDYPRALTLLKRSTDAKPNNSDAFLGLGQAYENLNRLDDAEKAYQTAANLDSSNFLAEMFLNRVHDKQRASGVKKQ